MKIGVIGCGKIFSAYAKGAALYKDLELAACADMDVARAQAVAKEFNVPTGCGVDELLRRDDIGLIINLTIPAAHAAVDRKILEAGKHAYSEKPLALNVAESAPLLGLATDRKLRLGCAPDTFLGSGHQLCRSLVDQGAIGRITSGVAFMAGPGHESWHPSPQFYYQPGGGPLFDMGPYYITALVNLIGPVAEVCGFAGRAKETRLITSQPLAGTSIPVEVDTHVSASLRFRSGAIITLIMSFDVWKHNLPRIEVYGTGGALSVPDPNGFDGAVQLAEQRGPWRTMTQRHAPGQRGAGAADMVAAVRTGRAHRCSAELANHVLEVMEAIAISGSDGRPRQIGSRCERPAAMPPGLAPGIMD